MILEECIDVIEALQAVLHLFGRERTLSKLLECGLGFFDPPRNGADAAPHTFFCREKIVPEMLDYIVIYVHTREKSVNLGTID